MIYHLLGAKPWPFGANLNKTDKSSIFSLQWMCLKMFANWWPFCLDLNVLRQNALWSIIQKAYINNDWWTAVMDWDWYFCYTVCKSSLQKSSSSWNKYIAGLLRVFRWCLIFLSLSDVPSVCKPWFCVNHQGPVTDTEQDMNRLL